MVCAGCWSYRWSSRQTDRQNSQGGRERFVHSPQPRCGWSEQLNTSRDKHTHCFSAEPTTVRTAMLLHKLLLSKFLYAPSTLAPAIISTRPLHTHTGHYDKFSFRPYITVTCTPYCITVRCSFHGYVLLEAHTAVAW